MAYLCAELEKVRNIYGGYDCKTWVLQQSSPTQPTLNSDSANSIAITGDQAILLTALAVSLFGLVFSFKIVKKMLHSI